MTRWRMSCSLQEREREREAGGEMGLGGERETEVFFYENYNLIKNI
jgi:hypothetical protein